MIGRGALPEHDAGAQRDHDLNHRRHSDLIPPRPQRGLGAGVAGGHHVRHLEVLAAEGLDGAHRAQAFLDHGDDLALPRLHIARDVLDRLLEAEHEQQQEGHDCDRDQREVPVEPEHQAQHEDDRDDVHDDRQRRRRRGGLHRRDVAGDGRHQGAGPAAVS